MLARDSLWRQLGGSLTPLKYSRGGGDARETGRMAFGIGAGSGRARTRAEHPDGRPEQRGAGRCGTAARRARHCRHAVGCTTRRAARSADTVTDPHDARTRGPRCLNADDAARGDLSQGRSDRCGRRCVRQGCGGTRGHRRAYPGGSGRAQCLYRRARGGDRVRGRPALWIGHDAACGRGRTSRLLDRPVDRVRRRWRRDHGLHFGL